jgi:Rrf2 family protein
MIAGTKNKPISASKIADKVGASVNHLSKILQRLVKNGFIESTRGPSGGFVIIKPAEEINFYDVYTAIQGEFKESNCPLCRKKCPFNSCFYEGKLHGISNEFIDFLKNKKLAEFLYTP